MHNVTERDGIFTVRGAAWHGLCVDLDHYPTREEAQKIAHPWEPITTPVYQKVPTITPHTHTSDCSVGCFVTDDLGEEYVPLDDFKLVERSDNGYPLGVVPKTLEVLNNSEMYDIAEAIEGEAKGSVRYETGGSLLGGRKVWLLIRLREPIVISGDPNGAVIPYYALQDSKDGSGSFRGQATMTRIVCDNTAQMADFDAKERGTEFVFRHTKNVGQRIEQAKYALEGWRHSIESFRMMMEHLVTERVTTAQVDDYVERFIPAPPPHAASDRVMNNVRGARRQLYSILEGATSEGIARTKYGLVQASVEYLNWARTARTDESRFKRAYLDRDRLVADSIRLVGAL